MRKALSLTITLVLAVALVLPAARADVPENMNVQGRLTDGAGDPVSPGLKNFTFKIFDLPVGGTEIWPRGPGELQTIPTDGDGLWNAAVGTVIPLTEAVFQDTSRWLEVTVDDGINPPETLPRIKLNTDPFTYRAATAQNADAVGGLTAPDMVDAFVNESGDLMTGTLNMDGGMILSHWAHEADAQPSIEVQNESTIDLTWNHGTHAISGWVSSDDPDVKYGVYGGAFGDDGVNVGVFGQTSGSATEQYAGYFIGGDIWVIDPATPGDSSVRLPNNAIASGEMLDEPGLAHGFGGFSINITGAMTDMATVTIQAPVDGYIILYGSAGIEISSPSVAGYVYVQIDETAGGLQTNGYWHALGFNPLPTGIGTFDWSCSVQRVYQKPAGTYTFRLEARAVLSASFIYAHHPRITALFVPTSYGSVSAVATATEAARFEQARPLAEGQIEFGAGAAQAEEDLYEVDLRELEVRVARAEAAAERARRELVEAELRALGPVMSQERRHEK